MEHRRFQRQFYPKKSNTFVEILREYCSNTTLHGLVYIGSRDKSLFEKICWSIFFLLSVLLCSFLISETWTKWQENPVILSFEKKQTNIWAIPFPAVTVCPINKIRKTAYNYTHMFRMRQNLNGEVYKEFCDLSMICDLDKYNIHINCSINITDESSIESMRTYAPDLNYTVGGVTWQTKLESDEVFAYQLTEEGQCFTFNSFGQNDMYTDQLNENVQYISHNVDNSGWTMDEGYPVNASMYDIPRRSAKDGSTSGIGFGLFTRDFDQDYVCSQPATGFKITLHSPVETPKIAQQYFLAPLNRRVTLIVRPQLTTTSKSLRSLSPDKRNCYFSNEKSLKFFRFYTQNNCRLECNANLTLHYCGCVPFYMPREKGTLICGYARMSCIKVVAKHILTFEMLKNKDTKSKKDENIIGKAEKLYKKCDCLPACNYIQYSAETSQTETHSVKSLLVSGLMDEVLTPEMVETLSNGMLTETQVDIFFKESQFTALHRSELIGQIDFLANCGGLLGLFMGFSVLSLLEIVYFVTIRLCITYRKNNLSPIYLE